MGETDQLVSGLKTGRQMSSPLREVLALVQEYEALRRERDVLRGEWELLAVADYYVSNSLDLKALAERILEQANKAREG